MKNLSDSDYCTVTARQACDRLAIAPDTLYAYVSRGLVRTIAHPADARRSLYDRRDIETLLLRKGRGRSRRAVAESTINWGEPVLTSRITRIADGRFFYKGQDAIELSRTQTLEEVLFLLAGVRCRPEPDTQPHPEYLPEQPFERILHMMASETISGGAGDGRPRAGIVMRKTAMAAAGAETPNNVAIHELLALAWSQEKGVADIVRRALVLCADHELNASAYAARVAASAGASIPASLLAGLATLSGTRHGGLTLRCHAWMDRVEKGGAGSASVLMPEGEPPPGFAHPLYPDGDPRAVEILTHLPVSQEWQGRVERIAEELGVHPSLDFALAMLERLLRLPEGVALAIFAVGRTAGWLAHIFEQRRSGRLIRPRAAHG
ncbi:citrate synthase [Hoeflea prorocentri]|uniref:citrate synthase (unknown stereospecificity) n=1 Tax=Hoeflea prorocentri TaxID=1922333 RepID=A0A9X3UJH3_9HYPH|nr:citrate synthase [Hoeflea prorocentri]MCY6381742.1 citrate synthase [Hoeflea prorocentri]MDA5399542.1 citrate synthase [Hoeflea prorocentri]